MLGVYIKVAVQWQQASAGDWAAYAADVSQRPVRQINTQHRIHDHVPTLLAHLLPTAEQALTLEAHTLSRPL
jgi:hypothetical protein